MGSPGVFGFIVYLSLSLLSSLGAASYLSSSWESSCMVAGLEVVCLAVGIQWWWYNNGGGALRGWGERGRV